MHCSFICQGQPGPGQGRAHARGGAGGMNNHQQVPKHKRVSTSVRKCDQGTCQPMPTSANDCQQVSASATSRQQQPTTTDNNRQQDPVAASTSANKCQQVFTSGKMPVPGPSHTHGLGHGKGRPWCPKTTNETPVHQDLNSAPAGELTRIHPLTLGHALWALGGVCRLPTLVAAVHTRRATSVRQVTPVQSVLGRTESDTGRSGFLLSRGCGRSGYYRVAHGTGLIGHGTPVPCQWQVWSTLACPCGPVLTPVCTRWHLFSASIPTAIGPAMAICWCSSDPPTHPTPTVTRRYLRALTLLFDPAVSSVEDVQLEAVGASSVTISWTLGGYLKFPWRPRVARFRGVSVYTLDPATGLVVEQAQEWEKSAGTALWESFTPTFVPYEPI